MTSPSAIEIKLLQKSATLLVQFDNQQQFSYSAALLRQHSPSAEKTNTQSSVLSENQMSEHQMNISAIEPVGNYAIRLVFNDGHNTGIYSWAYLYELGSNLAATQN